MYDKEYVLAKREANRTGKPVDIGRVSGLVRPDSWDQLPASSVLSVINKLIIQDAGLAEKVGKYLKAINQPEVSGEVISEALQKGINLCEILERLDPKKEIPSDKIEKAMKVGVGMVKNLGE